ncbi:unnamed protein product [Phytomonas sp. Hart1]|nr:unnamed protein product [Phytomonas sp. Hart1]|eukprot:CCW67334.1 unnamed protein product [Phytomonas sp. isolate Hart1]
MDTKSSPVNIDENDIKAALAVNIRPHVRMVGILNTHPKVIANDLEAIKMCDSIQAVTAVMETIRNRWSNLGIFRTVNYNFEPTQNGEKGDICVRIDVEENKPKKSIGIFTTDTSLPEVTVAFENALGGRYSIKGNYIPPASRVHSLSVSLLSNVPFIGQNAEYYIGRRTESKAFHVASGEHIEEVKATTQTRKFGILSNFTIGFQRRTLLAKNKRSLPETLLSDFSTTNKGYIRHELELSRLAYHANMHLYNMYPLPIYGHSINLTNELAGGIIAGSFDFLKSELQCCKHWPLGPFFSFQWGLKLAGIYPFMKSHIPLNDRLFLSNSHVRGFKSIGPSTLDFGPSQQFAATGGNALWATSLNLNFPLLFFPNNGLAAMHLFVNAGNLRMVETFRQFQDAYSWFRKSACSFGMGIVITRIPLFGISSSGRFELNFSIPLGIDKHGNVAFRNGNCNVFDKIKFGLVWSSNLSI